jgi:hypothetical protein
MERLVKHKLLIALMAVLALAGGGAAYAATQTATNPQQSLLKDVAKRLNVTPAQLRSAIQGALIDRLDAAVKAGRLTQAQANAIKQRIKKGGLRLGAFGGGAFRLHRAFRFGPGMAGGFGPPMMFLTPFAGAAKYLGISRSQLLSDLRTKTLAQVAEAQGKSVSGLEQAIVAAQKARLDKLVSAGALTRTQEQQRLSALNKMVSQLVEHARVTAAPAGKLPFFGGPPARRRVLPGGPAANLLPGPPAGGPPAGAGGGAAGAPPPAA